MGKWLNLDSLKASYAPILQKITTVEELKEYLNQREDSYSAYMLKLIERKRTTLATGNQEIAYQEVHHILPRAIGGPDEDWNYVPVSFEEHNYAHELRFLAFKEPIDDLFIRLRKNQTAASHKVAADAGRATQKERMIGLFDLSKQSARGKKGGAKQTEKKREKYREKISEKVRDTLAQYTLWRHTDKATMKTLELILAPFEVDLVRELYELLDQKVPFENRVVTNHTSGLARLMKRERKTYCGWTVHTFANLEEVELFVSSLEQE